MIILKDTVLKKISNILNLFGTSVSTCYALIKKTTMVSCIQDIVTCSLK